jgi:hypothetical protein
LIPNSKSQIPNKFQIPISNYPDGFYFVIQGCLKKFRVWVIGAYL